LQIFSSEVVLVEFRWDMWTGAPLVGQALRRGLEGEIDLEMYNVFVPTTPQSHLEGYLVFLPFEMKRLEMTVGLPEDDHFRRRICHQGSSCKHRLKPPGAAQ